MERTQVINPDNGTTISADVLSRTDKRMRVIINGTGTPLDFRRSDLRRPYVYRSGPLTLHIEER